MQPDPHSFAQPSDAVVTHLRWNASVDFATRTITAVATWDISTSSRETDLILFDTKDLEIEKVLLDGGQQTEYRLSEKDSLFGQALGVLLQPGTKSVSIYYKTSPGAEALQWLEPSQTAGKQHPFMFTQSQAILARSWVPCQDSPSVRFTYDAEVVVPDGLMALMSASNPLERNENGQYRFAMKQPIPSYLLALAVGDIRFRAVSERAGIYAEPSMLEKAHNEFADLEKMVEGAEQLYGRYPWERYDVLVLPPSFPFGGMENPRVTFATPTILAGDRSLTSLIAHELAHSWSGNLVTNATWNDFWLNEGFTVYFEHRIMEKLYGRDYSEMLASLALQDLRETITDLRKNGLYEDTKLKLNLEGRNPDEGVTDIAYNKGYFFLRSIEEKWGREKFDAFVNSYFKENAFRSMDTDAFIAFIKGFYQSNYSLALTDSLFNDWIFSEGLPSNCPVPSARRFDAAIAALGEWQKTGTASVQGWSTHEWLHFLKNLPDSLSPKQMEELDQLGGFTTSGNAEISAAWLVHAIRNQYKTAYPKLEQFLIHTGRRKFLSPLYNELVKTPEGLQWAKEVYRKARPNYHFVATSTFDKMFDGK